MWDLNYLLVGIGLQLRRAQHQAWQGEAAEPQVQAMRERARRPTRSDPRRRRRLLHRYRHAVEGACAVGHDQPNGRLAFQLSPTAAPAQALTQASQAIAYRTKETSHDEP